MMMRQISHTLAIRYAAAAALLSVFPALGQSPGEKARPTFEVASIKPTQTQSMNSGFRRASPGSLNATNVTVRFLIQWAYDLREDQVSGGPSWIDTDRYEIVAKPPENSDLAAKLLRQRTQNLLADRFHVAVHRQTKEGAVFALTVAKNGPKGLKEPSAARPDFVNNGHHLSAQRLSIASFAKDFLAPQVGRTVIDKTGIAGEFDFTLDWTPDDAQPTTASADGASAPAQFPSLVAAIQEQLGFKLEPQRGPVEVLVIDHAEKPADN